MAAAAKQHGGVTLELGPKERAALAAYLDGTAKTVDPSMLVALRQATDEASKAMRAQEEAEKGKKVQAIKDAASLLEEVLAKEYLGVTKWSVGKDESSDGVFIRVHRGAERVLSVGGPEKSSRKERRERRRQQPATASA